MMRECPAGPKNRATRKSKGQIHLIADFFFYFVEERRQKNNSESRLLKLAENNLVQANTNWLISNSMLMSLKSSDFGQICEMSNVSI